MNRPFFPFLVASFGALALVGQILLLRQLLVAFYGNELVIALVLAAWLSGVWLGARAAGLAAPRPGRLKRWLAVTPLLWLAALGGLLGLSYHLSGLTGLAPGEAAPLSTVLFWTIVLTAPSSCFAGGLFVLAGSCYQAFFPGAAPSRGGIGGTIFWIESAGSCLGLLVYTFLLAGRLGPVRVWGLLAWTVAAALVLTLAENRGRRLVLAAAVLLAGAWLNLGGPARALEALADRTRFLLSHPGYELLAVEDTPYQHLTLAARGGERALFGNQIFTAAWPDPYTYQSLTLFFLTESAAHRRVLLAGQGPGGFIHEFLRLGVAELVYVALDPAETRLAAGDLPPEQAADLADPRLTIIHDDLRRFLGRPDPIPFDLIVVCAPDPDNAQINRLYTLEFFQAARRHLVESGVLITSIGGADNYWSPDLVSYGRSLYRTMRAVFPEVVVTPGDRNYFLAGVKPGLVSDDPEILAARFHERGYMSQYFRAESFRYIFLPSALAYVRSRLAEVGGGSRLNTDSAPLSYYLRLIWWEQRTGGYWTRSLLAGLLEVRAWGPWAVGLLVLPLVFLLARPGRARAAVFTVAGTGGVTMALQILLIFMYQNRHGVIYQQIGLLSALFMAGLAAGGWLGRAAAGRTWFPWAVPVLETGLALTAGLMALCAWGRLPDVILPLTGLTGLVSGAEFSLFFALFLEDPAQPPVRRALTRLEAADHGGAVLGALAAGLVLAPVLGLGPAALFLAGYKLLSALVLLRTAVAK
ncbi:MAG: hypothetical protein AB1896_06160 [Thermodesulfobacteriota bacterium]